MERKQEYYHKQYQYIDIVLKNLSHHLILYGKPGIGKTYMIKQYVHEHQLELYTPDFLVNGSLLGFYNDSGEYVYSSFEKAIINGGVFFYDEFGNLSEENKRIIKLITEASNVILGDQKEYPIHPNFVFLSTANHLTEDSAINDRLYKLPIEFDRELEENLKNKRRLELLGENKIPCILDDMFIQIVDDYNNDITQSSALFVSLREILNYQKIIELVQKRNFDAEMIFQNLWLPNWTNEFLAFVMNHTKEYNFRFQEEKKLALIKIRNNIALTENSSKVVEYLENVSKKRTEELEECIRTNRPYPSPLIEKFQKALEK